MKSASPALLALLATRKFIMTDLYTITLVDGVTVLRYTSADTDIKWNGNIFKSLPLKRGAARTVIGVAVDTLDFSAFPRASDLVQGLAFLSAARSGLFDGAWVALERGFGSAWPQVTGTLIQFYGRVSELAAGRSSVDFRIKSALELLDVQMPRNVYQAVCLHTLYDSGCAALKSAYTVAGAAAGSCTTTGFGSGLTEAAGYFDQGVLKFTSGANAGLSRTVKAYDGSHNFTFALAWPVPPALGDSFTVYPGCDKTKDTCQSKFGNLGRFKGYPYIPVPETTF
jgi:uncharacterized phage protein (TIGR02218 family)